MYITRALMYTKHAIVKKNKIWHFPYTAVLAEAAITK